jgi:hypothetical protein
VVIERDLLGEAEDRKPAARQNACSDGRVRLHRLEFVGAQLAELQQDRVRNSDFAYVVQWCGAANECHLRDGQSQLPGDERRHLADALGMLTRIVVPELRRTCEALDDLDLRRLQLARPVAHLPLENLILALHLEVEEPRLEQRSDPQQYLVTVKRFVQKIFRPAREGFPLCFRSVIAGQHQNRKVARLNDLIELVHHLKPVPVRHVKVQEDEVGPEPDVYLGDLSGIGGRFNLAEPCAFQQPSQEIDVRRLVVHDEDARFLEHPRSHQVSATSHETAARSAFEIVSAAGESGHCTEGAAVYAACARAPWKNAVSDA